MRRRRARQSYASPAAGGEPIAETAAAQQQGKNCCNVLGSAAGGEETGLERASSFWDGDSSGGEGKNGLQDKQHFFPTAEYALRLVFRYAKRGSFFTSLLLF